VLAGEPISTTVDSVIARYYLENYLLSEKKDLELHRKIEEWYQSAPEQEITGTYIQDLCRRFSPDFATVYLAKRILEDKANRRIRSVFQAELARAKRAVLGGEKFGLPRNHASFVILFAPAWLYNFNAETGADFAKPRKILSGLGIDTQLIPTDESGGVETNAEIIAKEILQHRRKQIILVSASKSGAEVAHALGVLLSPEETKSVRSWINIGGLLRGTPLADLALSFPKRWFVRLLFLVMGWKMSGLESITTMRSQARFRLIKMPDHVLVINYMAIPLSGHLTERAKKKYSVLRAYGPNDGLTLHLDGMMPGGFTIAELGLDHYYMDPEIDLKSVALASMVLGDLNLQEDVAPDPIQKGGAPAPLE